MEARTMHPPDMRAQVWCGPCVDRERRVRRGGRRPVQQGASQEGRLTRARRQAAGGYGMTGLWGVLPPLMACSLPPAKLAVRGALRPAALALAFGASVGAPGAPRRARAPGLKVRTCGDQGRAAAGVEIDCLAKDGVLRGAAAAVVPSLVTSSQALWHAAGAP